MSTSPKTLTEEESSKLIETLGGPGCSQRTSRKCIRNQLIGLLMLEAGLRVGEVTRLFQSDLTIGDEPVLALRISKGISKNRKERIIPLTQRIRNMIETVAGRWWGDHTTVHSGYAFFNSDPHIHISSRQVERIIKLAAEESIGRPVHPHVLRHTFASRLMRTSSASVVQELLGHKHLTSTQVYMHPNQTDLKNAIKTIEGENNGIENS